MLQNDMSRYAFTCDVCGSGWNTPQSLRGHKNSSRICKEMANEIEKNEVRKLSMRSRPIHEDDVTAHVGYQNLEETSTRFTRGYPSDFTLDTEEHCDNLLSEDDSGFSSFNASTELLVAFKSCNNGVGLSISDMTLILKVVTHPSFKPDVIAFTNGKQANDLVKELVAETRSKEVCKPNNTIEHNLSFNLYAIVLLLLLYLIRTGAKCC